MPQTAIDPGIYGERVAIVLGLATAMLALATFASCQSFVGMLARFGLNPMRTGFYQAFFRYHSYYWWIFGVMLLSHLMMSTLHTGLPQADDPDAGIHWWILSLGATALVMSLTLFGSCRVFPGLVSRAVAIISPASRAYKSVYLYHSYYWLALGLLAGTHFAIAYLHAGVWPGGG